MVLTQHKLTQGADTQGLSSTVGGYVLHNVKPILEEGRDICLREFHDGNQGTQKES